ncbi:hypothetical protein BC628DRAFT_1417143 [Trametes gibbosa]|nr:hypothetical protein BC628DRAFT_1417143 [Trametes gibbosa]
MPRLFPSLGRSSKDRQYEGYDAPHGYYDYGYPEQEPRQHRSAWSKVLNRKSTKRSYVGEDPSSHSYPGGFRATVEDYPEDPRMHPGQAVDEFGESFEDLLSGRNSDTAIPLVQRESSLTRLQQAFADNGTYAPAMSAAPSMSMYAPQPRMAGQPHVSAVNDLHQPAMVVNSPVPMQGLRPDVVHHSASYPTTRDRPHRRHREHERERSAPPRAYRDHREHPAYWEDPLDPREEPPVVVVVEHGKNGKKDKYYIIPGGAPVIFEDEDGNELTRVGDFSGHYRPPRRPRPVIVQDQYGNEICRGGFSNDDHISVGSRDNYPHHTSRSGVSDRRGRSTHRSQDQRGHSSRHESSHSSRMFAPDSYHNDPHYQPSRPRAGTRSSRDDPNVVFVDPNQGRGSRSHRSGSSSDTLVRSSPRDHHSNSGRSHDRPRDYPDERERERERGRDYHQRDHYSRRP